MGTLSFQDDNTIKVTFLGEVKGGLSFGQTAVVYDQFRDMFTPGLVDAIRKQA